MTNSASHAKDDTPSSLSASTGSVILAGDIGGTKTNLGLFSGPLNQLKRVADNTYPSQSAQSLTELVERFLKETGDHAISKACFGIAGPVFNNVAKATNLPWTVDGDEMQQHFSWSHVRVVNDLVALASAIPYLQSDQLQPLNDVAPPETDANIGLIAAGTGLGEALLIWDGNSYVPCPSEGGHKDFAPRNQMEWRLHQYLTKKYQHASVERVLSGNGLHDIYQFLRQESGDREPEWLARLFREQDGGAVVSQTALAGKDPICEQALDLFVEIYGAEAGNLALQAFTTGGMYIGGGIGPKIAKALASGKFIEAFRAKGRMKSLLSNIPVRLILDSKAALMGAAVSAMQ